MPPVPVFELHFSVLTSLLTHCSLNARQCSSMLTLSSTLPKSETVAPGVRGKQEPPRRARSGAPTCSRESLVGMFSHAHQPTGRETASPDPTRVLTKGESDIEEWHDDTWERRNRPLLSAWGLRLTQIIIAVAILAQAPDLGESRK